MVKIEELEKELNQRILKNIYILYGEELFLLENALKYISEPFEISVSLSQHNRKCILEVYNSCEPFAGDPNLLFERFYRGDEAHSSNVSGQGIGLSIAKAIMDIHHGKISAQMFHNGILFKVEL